MMMGSASTFGPGQKNTGSLSLRSLSSADLKAIFQNAFLVYTAFLMLGSVLYTHLGGRLLELDFHDGVGLLSTVAEGFGLLFLRWKIQKQASVAGISGMTMVMFGLCYAIRGVQFPPLDLEFLDAWAVKVLEQSSFFLVADVIRSVFLTYKSTYQRELDVLRVQYLVPVCVLLSFVVYPEDQKFSWTAAMYMDTVALMPQVVMMSKGDGMVEAPISHFVAATALSRGVDLYYWGWETYEEGISYSGLLVLSVHVIYQLLVADFSYYYWKLRLKSRSLSEHLELPTDDII